MHNDRVRPSGTTCPRCGREVSAAAAECPGCGVIFARLAASSRKRRRRTGAPSESWRVLLDRALTLPPDPDAIRMAAQATVWLSLLLLGWSLMAPGIRTAQLAPSLPLSLLSNVNLVFHEAGHVLFRPLGEFLTILGGALLQVLVPALCTLLFLTRHRDPFGASVTLWWVGQSLLDLAPYIHDARAQQLILLGGVTGRDRRGYHDWNNLLGRLGWLDHDQGLAGLCHGVGAGLVVLALVWGLYLILGQAGRLRAGG